MAMTKPTSEQVTFLQSGSGATARTVDAKLKDTVSVKDFGAVGDGVTDDTVALKAAFDSAIPLKVAVELFGTYKVSGPVTTTSSIASGGLHIICRGDVGVNVDAASTAFAKLFNIYTNNASEFNNVSITGGSLTVNLNNKCGIGFYLRRIESTPFQSSPIGGTINIESPVTILNAKDATAAVEGESAGFQVFGNYRSVYINSPTVIGVERLTSGGTCVGIGVGYCGGEVTIFRPYIKNVLHSTQNADGINVAGLHGDPITPPLESWGKIVVTEPTFVDCQGRSFKSQFSNTVVTKPSVYRQSVVSIASGNDFDFQRGNGILDTPTFEYRLNGATSPLGASFSPVVFQQVLSDTNMVAICRDALLKTEVPMNQFCLLVVDGTSDSSSTEVSGLTVMPLGSFATTAIVNCVVNLPNAVNLVSMSGNARISIHDLYGPISCAMLGYTGYTSGSVADKLVLEVYNTRTTIAATAFNGFMYAVSGNKIQGIDSVFVHSNQGSLVSIWNYGGPPNTFDFSTMTVGTVVVLDLSSVITVANAPPWGTVFALSEKAVAECLAERSSGTRYIRATLMSGVAPFQTKVFLSSDSGATWFTESESPPRTITADYALAGSDKTLISNKSGSTCVLTLPTASTVTGRHITIKNTQAQLVTSASANVVPITGGAAGTAILAATSGVWATIVSDGTNWITISN